MPSKFWDCSVGWLALTLIAGSLLMGSPASGEPPAFPSYRNLPAESFRPGRVIVFPKSGRELQLQNFHKAHGFHVRRQYPLLRRMQVIEVPAGTDTLDAIEAYQRSGLVESAEPDVLFRPALEPNDPSFLDGTQWPLNNIHAPEAWDRFKFATNVIVAIIDSGVRSTHEDLVQSMWVNPGEIPGNGIDDDGNGYIDDIHGINAVANSGLPTDELGHGSHVAGIIGAVGNNGLGTCGVAWRARIMACRFLSPGQLGQLSDLSECVNYAIAKGAKVLNCSFTTPIYTSGISNIFLAARDAGIVVAAAAGNSGTDNDVNPIYPASVKLDNIVSVTATTVADTFSGYNYGMQSVHLAAPGSAIWSTYNRSDSDYAFETGTSMSAPHVAGALALLRSRYPQLGHQEIIARLLASVDPLPALVGRCTTGGRLNLNLAVGTPDYIITNAPFSWVATNGMAGLELADNDVSEAISIPFPFPFYGRIQSLAYVSANGMLGFENAGLDQGQETTLPKSAAPNAAVYPYWDDLNPGGGGQIWTGMLGIAPNRKFIVSWVAVPHISTSGGETRLTFQVILHETGEIVFQYLDVQNGRTTLNSGRSATIGIEDSFGHVASTYAVHGAPAIVTNMQAIVMAPQGYALTAPSFRLRSLIGNHFYLSTYAVPGHPCVLSTSTNLQYWTAIETNIVPASGVIDSSRMVSGDQRYYRIRLEP